MKFLLSLLFFMQQQSWATPQTQILILQDWQQRPHFLAKLKVNPNFKPYSQYSIEKALKKSQTARLKTTFKKAQFYFLKGDFTKSQQMFKKIAQKATSFHWSSVNQKMIFFSLLRLAQIPSDFQKKFPSAQNHPSRLWVRRAKSFAPHLTPNRRVFPPPLVKSWKSIKTNTLFTLWTPPKTLQHFHQVYINGRKVSLTTTPLSVPTHQAHYLFVSDQHKAIEITADAKSLKEIIFSPQPAEQLPCQEPFTSFPSSFCSSRTLKNLTLKAAPQPISEDMAMEKRIQNTRQTKSRSRWKTKHWVAVGLGALATAFVVYQKNRTSKSSNPSSKDGF